MSRVDQRTQDEVIRIAHERGLVCVFPAYDELLLDIDSDVPTWGLIFPVLTTLTDNGIPHGKEILITVSAGGNKHVYIKLGVSIHSVTIRSTLQAAMGSDPLKETLSAIRAYEGGSADACIALFETTEQYARVMEWRLRVSEVLSDVLISTDTSTL